jgi:SAM-dependent methyltransferase
VPELPVNRPALFKKRLKWLLFPGLDLHTRCRYRFLPKYFLRGPIDTLDAGCGNGALSYAAYRLGNRVLGITSSEGEVQRNRELFARAGICSDRLAFQQLDLYDLPCLDRRFDQIICSETLEHIARDELILAYFHNVLNPAGVLHLCSPFALHPLNNLGRTGEPEDGRHVRDGYTLETYTTALSRAGFDIVCAAGLGSPLLVGLDQRLRWLRNCVGDAFALPLFLFLLPLSWLDRPDPDLPFSLYVRAVKSGAGELR